MRGFIENEFKIHLDIVNSTLTSTLDSIILASNIIINTLNRGNKIMICGNGGSASDSQHFAAELVGRYKKNRLAIPCIALTTDTSILTAVGNDFGFEYIFSRQVEALGLVGDLLIAISTSGTSKNIINAINSAKNKNCKILGLSGNGGGAMNDICDINIAIPSKDTPRIQEMHLLIEHTLCDIIERSMS